MLDRVLGVLSTVPFVIGSTLSAAPASHPVFAFTDPAIVESSGLVVHGGLFATMNDSGDTGRVFTVDAAGDTVGTTYWSDDPVDVESLAPAGGSFVWVGDTGGNTVSRDTVEIAKVPVGRGDRTVQPTVYRLQFPDGDHDTETMVRNPKTGRIYLVTKGLLGGTLYSAPKKLDPDVVNPLTPVGDVLAIATDGAFFPDGRHLIVRNYGEAAVYRFPSMHLLGTFDLPSQRQGEGLAVASGNRIFISSEGQYSKVLQVRLPKRIAKLMKPASSREATEDQAVASSSTSANDAVPWRWLGMGAVGAGALVVLLRSLRPR